MTQTFSAVSSLPQQRGTRLARQFSTKHGKLPVLPTLGAVVHVTAPQAISPHMTTARSVTIALAWSTGLCAK